MIVKLVIGVVVAILLRRHWRLLKSLCPLWPIGVGLAVGAVPGWLYATFLMDSGQAFDSLLGRGLPPVAIKLAFALIGALVTVKPVNDMISSFFLPREAGK